MRRLLALCALSLCVPALLADEKDEAAAIDALKKIGAKVQVEKKGGSALKGDCMRKPVTDDQLKHLEPLTKVRILNLGGAKNKDGSAYLPKQIGDKGLAHVAGMTELRELMLDGTAVTDEGLKSLENLKQ